MYNKTDQIFSTEVKKKGNPVLHFINNSSAIGTKNDHHDVISTLKIAADDLIDRNPEPVHLTLVQIFSQAPGLIETVSEACS
jgi:hypothetical protein